MKKLKLEDLKVHSFITELNGSKLKTVHGGGQTDKGKGCDSDGVNPNCDQLGGDGGNDGGNGGGPNNGPKTKFLCRTFLFFC